MGFKLAISGKGGVGKTVISAMFARVFSEDGFSVLAVDADPNSNLAFALGFPQSLINLITPISEMKELIKERTHATGGFFRLNPKVEDLPDRYCCEYKGVKLLLMSRVKYSSGCYCPENALLKNLIQHLLLERNEVIIMDMEAGVEHLSRGTASSVENFIIVVEPTRPSLETANRISDLAKALGMRRVLVLANKIRTPDEIQFIKENLPSFEILGFLPYDEEVLNSSKLGISPYDTSSKLKREIIKLKKKLVQNGEAAN